MNPIAFLNGDGGSGRVANILRRVMFANFPTVDVLMDKDARLKTNDACIVEALNALHQCGSGFKNSTASDHPDIKKAGLMSANIVLRRMAGAFALERVLQGPGNYEKTCGTLRYAHGSFYDEVSCVEEMINGKKVAVITQHMNLDDLVPFALLAKEIAQKHDLALILSSKSTIATSERWFRDRIEAIWRNEGVTWTHKLTDFALAELPVKTALAGSKKGGFLHVSDNANGDSSSDIIDHQHGNFVMGSRVHCIQDGKHFTYEELPGGTADKMEFGDLSGDNFYNPSGMIFALVSAFEKVNPEQSAYFEAIRTETLNYLNLNRS